MPEIPHPPNHRDSIWLILAVLSLLLVTGCTSPPRVDRSASTSGEKLDASDESANPPSPDRPPLLSMRHKPDYSTLSIPASVTTDGPLDVELDRKWNYIVIHHSATASGSAKSFDKYHREELGWLGVGYHFVIGNGRGTDDGVVEPTFRWQKQIHGAHAGVDKYNQHGIGICLVGNLADDYPTKKQMKSLVALVNDLQKRCNIPTSRIMLHRHIKNTRCPGENFPYYQFISLLKH